MNIFTLIAFIFFIVLFVILAVWIDKTIDELFHKDKHTPEIEPQHNFDHYSVYVIVNSKNKKIYVGMTGDYERRKSEHFEPEYRLKQNHKFLYQEMEKLGPENFLMKKIIDGLSKNEALYVEATLIKGWSTYRPYGFNTALEKDNRQLGYNVKKYNKNLFEVIQKLKEKTNKPTYGGLK